MENTNPNDNLCDLDWIRKTSWPERVIDGPLIRIADLFAGCGGMTLGAIEALRSSGFRTEPVLAVDAMEPAIKVYRENFGLNESNAPASDIEEVIPGNVGDIAVDIPKADLVLAGPPCQGHSDLNNHSRRTDARNSLYLKVIRYAELAKPSVIIIENVPGVRHSKQGVVDRATECLEKMKYHVNHVHVDAVDLGIPQKRKRFLLVASKFKTTQEKLLSYQSQPNSTVANYIGDLVDEHEKSDEIYRTPSGMGPTNRRRAKWLFDHDEYDLPDSQRPPCHRDKEHSYVSMYGRIHWEQPAQTLTTGFGSMGQGRYLHSKRQTVITPHEAARLQGFPDFFDFSSVKKRTRLHTMIGNAVPPRIIAVIVSNLLKIGWMANSIVLSEHVDSAAE